MFSHGIGYISSVLKKSGHKTSLFHVLENVTREELHQLIKKTKPDLIGFSATTNQYDYVVRYSRWVKEVDDIPIICGGVHATLSPEEVFKNSAIDIVCLGEGEQPLLELMNNMEKEKDIYEIQNLWIKKGNSCIRNSIRPLISNLDDLPFPDRELFNFNNILKRSGYVADFMAGRGCPFECTYCCNHALRKIYEGKGKYVRMRSVRNVLDEIGQVVLKYKIRKLNFVDDTFTIRRKWIEGFCKMYPEEFDLKFQCNARVDIVDRQLLTELYNAGCDTVAFGVESGNECLRNNVLKRSITNRQIIEAFRTARDIGLKTYAYYMIGLPYETPTMIEETINLNNLISPDFIQFSIFYPYPNTELYEVCKKEGFLTGKQKGSYFDKGYVLNLPTLTEDQVEHYFEVFENIAFEKAVKRRRWSHPIYKILKVIMRNDISRTKAVIIKFKKSILG